MYDIGRREGEGEEEEKEEKEKEEGETCQETKARRFSSPPLPSAAPLAPPMEIRRKNLA